jgi:EAL domain-containing protein (putative c-di-GMP-specific phosphodiesterase class I)
MTSPVAVRSPGVRVALDDCGTGVDVLEIDRSA